MSKLFALFLFDVLLLIPSSVQGDNKRAVATVTFQEPKECHNEKTRGKPYYDGCSYCFCTYEVGFGKCFVDYANKCSEQYAPPRRLSAEIELKPEQEREEGEDFYKRNN